MRRVPAVYQPTSPRYGVNLGAHERAHLFGRRQPRRQRLGGRGGEGWGWVVLVTRVSWWGTRRRHGGCMVGARWLRASTSASASEAETGLHEEDMSKGRPFTCRRGGESGGMQGGCRAETHLGLQDAVAGHGAELADVGAELNGRDGRLRLVRRDLCGKWGPPP